MLGCTEAQFTHKHKQQQWDTRYLSALCPWLCGKNCTIIMREGEVNDGHDFWKKNPSSCVTGIPPRSILVSMSRINHTFPYSNRRIPACVVAMTQSLKGFLTRDLWLITSQTKDNLAVNCSGFTIKLSKQVSYSISRKNSSQDYNERMEITNYVQMG